MVKPSTSHGPSTPAQALGLGILALLLLSQSGSAAPFSHHKAHSLETQSTADFPRVKNIVNSKPSQRSPDYLKDQLQVLYDHLDQQQISDSLPSSSGHHSSSTASGLEFQSNVHPLGRRKQGGKTLNTKRERERLGHAASKMKTGGGEILQSELQRRQIEYQTGQHASLGQTQAQAASVQSDEEESTPAISEGRIGAAVSVDTDGVAGPASTSAAQVPKATQSSAAPVPTTSAPGTQSQSTASKSQASSLSASTSPSATKAKQTKDHDKENSSILDQSNKLFPLIVAGIVAAGLFGCLVLISIARACSHWRMRSTGELGGKLDENGNLTGAGAIKAGRRSLRRVITGRNLGSFQRRTREGSVLIEVGDEVFAVPPHIAEEYHRRQKEALNSGSASALGKAADTRGLDLQSWRLASAVVAADQPKRSLSTRLMDSLRALRGVNEDDEDEKTCYSFDSEKQVKGQMRQSNPNAFLPVITKGNGSWDISTSDESSEEDHQFKPNYRRQFIAGPRETPQLGRADLPITPKPQTPMMLSHERVQLSDGPVATSNSSNLPGGFPGRGRTLQDIRRDEIRKVVSRPSSRGKGNANGGSYRHKRSDRPSSNSINRARSMAVPRAGSPEKRGMTSTGNSSPAIYAARSQRPPSPQAALQPERPTAVVARGTEPGKRVRVPTFRHTLPMPPHLSPIASSPRPGRWMKDQV